MGWNLIDNYINLPVDIIGTLYSKAGADLMIRNIYRCHQLTGLIIFDDNQLGHNNMGKHGLSHVYQFFFNKHYQCNPYDRKLLDRLIVYYIRSDHLLIKFFDQITLVNVTNVDLRQLIQEIRSIPQPHKFSHLPIIYQNPCTLLSNTRHHHHETFGTAITGNDLFDSWKELLNYLYDYGSDNEIMRQFHSIHWSFDTKNTETSLEKARGLIQQDDIQNIIGISQMALNDYTKSIMEHIEIPNISYTYGQRLKIYEQNIIKTLQEQLSSRTHMQQLLNMMWLIHNHRV